MHEVRVPSFRTFLRIGTRFLTVPVPCQLNCPAGTPRHTHGEPYGLTNRLH